MSEFQTSQLCAALKQVLHGARQCAGAPGISAGISAAGIRMIAENGMADSGRNWPLSPSSRFGIGCITKLLAAIVVNQMAREGILSLDAVIDGPSAGLDESFSQRGITLRHLLTHTAGFQGPLMFGVSHRQFNQAGFQAHMAGAEQLFAPGTVFNYDNTGHVIIGEVVRNVTGAPLMEQVKTRIFAPLGIEPGAPLSDYKSSAAYVAPHRLEDGIAKTVAPSIFGPFWSASLADITLSVDDMLKIGEALVGTSQAVDFSWIRPCLQERAIRLPQAASGLAREHVPQFFNPVCAEYGSGWYGYAGSSPGQTCGIRFDIESRTVCVVAMNAWLPVARDGLLDQLCGVKSHPEAGAAGGNPGIGIRELAGTYHGGGNIFRTAEIRIDEGGALHCEIGSGGPSLGAIRFSLDAEGQLIPEKESLTPGIGFFRDPASGAPCLLIGVASLRKLSLH